MLLGTVLVLLLLGSAGPATAHAALRSTDPEDGSVVTSAPRHLTLTFTESVGLLDDSFRVYDPDNRRVHLDEPQHADGRSDTARVSLPEGLGQGTFTVAWRVVSADSHPVSGAFTFSIGKPSPTPAAVPTDQVEDPVTGSLHDTARYLAYLAAALLIGTAAFAALCRPPDPGPLRMPLLTGWWTLLASTVVLLVLRAPYEAGTGPSFDTSSFTRTLTSRPGMALLARLVLLLVTAVLLVRQSGRRDGDGPTRPVLGAGVALAVGFALTWASAEHASAGIQVPLAMTSSVLHLLAMAVWLGGLAALLTTLYRSATPPSAAVVARFSRLAFASVTVLAVTGVYQSWRGLGSWTAFGDTPYGRILLLKLAAVVALLLAAAYSRRWTARLAATTETVREPVAGPRAVPLEGAPAPVAVAVSAAALAEGTRSGEPGASSQADSPVTADRDAERDTDRHQDPDAAPRPEKAGAGAEAGAVTEGGTRTPPPATPDRHRRALRRSVLAEVVVAIVVLMITTVLTGTTPGRAQAEAAQEAPVAGLPPAPVTVIPFDVGTPGGQGKVQITLDPGRVGENGVQAVVYGPDGGLTSVPELRLSFTLPAQKIGPIDARLTDRGGYWATNDLTLPIAGTWTMKATVRVSELDQVSVSRPVRIAP